MSAFRTRKIDGKRYNYDSNLAPEAQVFGRDRKIDRNENQTLEKILAYNKKKGRERLVLQNSRRQLERLRSISGVRRSVKRQINSILTLGKTRRTSKEKTRSSTKRFSNTRAIQWINTSISRRLKIAIKNKLPGRQGTDTKLVQDLKKFQRKNGLTPDGIPGRGTRVALGLEKGKRREQNQSNERVSGSLASIRKQLGIGSRFSLYSTAKLYNETGGSKHEKRTCLLGLRARTISGANALQKRVKAKLVITGGTEKGHTLKTGRCHERGYKLDCRPQKSLLRYLARLRKTKTFPMGAKMTRTIDGHRMTFLRHGPNDHIDITFV